MGADSEVPEDMTTITVNPDELFDLEPPPTQGAILREVWKDMQIVKKQVSLTNGRVTDLEKFRWIATGALVVIGLIVVPIFLGLLDRP